MSTILIAHKVECSERDCLSKHEQAHKSMLICSDVPKKAIKYDIIKTFR